MRGLSDLSQSPDEDDAPVRDLEGDPLGLVAPRLHGVDPEEPLELPLPLLELHLMDPVHDEPQEVGELVVVDPILDD